jgi:hypothetical protein
MSDEPPSVVEARYRVEQARARLNGRFDELVDLFEDLQQRLTPSSMARDAWEAAKSKGADLAEEAVDAVSRRPIAATGVIAAITLFLAREPLLDLAGKLTSGKKREPSRRKPKPAPQNSTEKVQ